MQTSTMQAQDIRKLNEYFYDEVFRRQHVDEIDDLLTSDFEEHIPAPGQATDREGAKNFIWHMIKAFPDLDFEIEHQIVEGDTIAVVGTMTGTHAGEFLGVAPTGRKIEATVMDMSRVRDGKFCDHWGLIDVPTLMAQLGIQPPTG